MSHQTHKVRTFSIFNIDLLIPNNAVFKALAIGDSQYEKLMIHVANADRVFAFHLALNMI